MRSGYNFSRLISLQESFFLAALHILLSFHEENQHVQHTTRQHGDAEDPGVRHHSRRRHPTGYGQQHLHQTAGEWTVRNWDFFSRAQKMLWRHTQSVSGTVSFSVPFSPQEGGCGFSIGENCPCCPGNCSFGCCWILFTVKNVQRQSCGDFACLECFVIAVLENKTGLEPCSWVNLDYFLCRRPLSST